MPRLRVIATIGRVFVATGVVLLLFVAYQLWGTGLTESRHQAALKHQFQQELHHPHSSSTSTSVAGGGGGDAPVVGDPSAAPGDGQPVGFLTIPAIGLDDVVVVEGTSTEDLRLGPGHYPGTPLPGQAGNAAIAGHRTTYGAPFYNLDQLHPKDPITIQTVQGTFVYDVIGSQVVQPSNTTVLAPPPAGVTAELTLTTCNPRYSASQRLVVQAELTGRAAAPSPPAPGHTTVRRTSNGLAGETAGLAPAVAWGTGCAAVVVVTWFVGRRRTRRGRRLVYGGGTVAFLAVLFFFFAAVSPLLPASF